MSFKYICVGNDGAIEVIHIFDVDKVEPGQFKHGNTIVLRDGEEYIVKKTGITKHPYLRDGFSLDVYFEEKK